MAGTPVQPALRSVASQSYHLGRYRATSFELIDRSPARAPCRAPCTLGRGRRKFSHGDQLAPGLPAPAAGPLGPIKTRSPGTTCAKNPSRKSHDNLVAWSENNPSFLDPIEMAASRNGETTALTASPFSLDPEMIQQIFDHAKPLGHGEKLVDLNLGFGFVYYGLVRALRPEHVVVI